MMYFSNFLLVATCLASSVSAFPGGAGGCAGGVAGVAAVGGLHLTRDIVTGPLSDFGITVSLNNVPLDSTATTEFSAGTTLNLTVTSPNDFLGVLMRVEAEDPNVDTSTALLEEDSDFLRDASSVCTAPVVGVTHNSRAPKLTASAMFSIPEAGIVTLDVTIVVSNSAAFGSEYYYTGFALNALPAAPTPAPPTPAPPTPAPPGDDSGATSYKLAGSMVSAVGAVVALW